MIESQFNVYAKIESGLLIYNSLHNSKVHLKNADKFQNYVEGNLHEFNNEEVNKLNDLGILVLKKSEENFLARKKLGELIFNNNLRLTILPTSQCNFSCRYCYEDFKNDYMNEEQIYAIQQYLYKNMKKYQRLEIEWFGGEPLLNICAIEEISESAIKLCRFYHIPYFSVITTNGYFLTTEVMKRLLKSKIFCYQITLDGLEDEHNYNRPLADGGNTFKKIINNLLSIKNNIKSNSFKIIIRYNVSKKSIFGLSEHLDYLKEKFGNDKRFEFTIFPVENWSGEKTQKTILNDKSIIFKTLMPYSNKLNIKLPFCQFQPYSSCPSLSINYFVINANGEVYKCVFALNDKYNPIGYIDKTGTILIDEKKLSEWSIHTPKIKKNCQKNCNLYANCFAKKCTYKNLVGSSRCYNNHLKVEENLKYLYLLNKKSFVEFN